jgi:transposase
VLAWHLITKDQDYAFARPSLITHKRRKLELAAGAPSRRGNHRLPGAAYNDKQRRSEEKKIAEQAERAYQVFVSHWQPTKPAALEHRFADDIRRGAGFLRL